MNNFKAHRKGFRFQAQIGPATSDTKRTFAVLDIMYLQGASRKGVLASLKQVEIEQCEGYCMETSTILGDGNFSIWAKVLARKSDKEVVRVAEALDSAAVDIVATFILDTTKGKTLLMNAVQGMAL